MIPFLLVLVCPEYGIFLNHLKEVAVWTTNVWKYATFRTSKKSPETYRIESADSKKREAPGDYRR